MTNKRFTFFAFVLLLVMRAQAGMLYPSVMAETLVVGGTQAPGTLGNPFGGSGQPASMVWSALYDGLTEFTVDGQMRGALATSWEALDPIRWRFTLREGVTFHNGRPFDASAVVGTFNYLLSDAGRGQLVASRLNMIDRVIADSEFSVIFETKEPYAILPKRLSLVMIVDPVRWNTEGVQAYAQEPTGTGPYRLEQWGAGGSHIVLSATNSTWRETGSVERVELLTLTDPASRLQALMSGAVDVAWNLDPDSIPLVESNNFRTSTVPLPNVLAVALRTEGNSNSPLQDLRVRQALNIAIDKEAMADLILGGLVSPASQGALPGTVGYDEEIRGYEYNPDRARSLLTEAGYKDGFDLLIEVTARLLPGDQLIFQKMAADLSSVGVRVTLRDIQLANFIRKYTSNQWGEVDAFSMTWNSAPMYDAIRPFEYYSCLKANPFFCEPRIANRIVVSNAIMDPIERERELKGIMSEMVDLAPAIFLTGTAYVVGLSNRIENLPADGMGIRYGEVTFKNSP